MKGELWTPDDDEILREMVGQPLEAAAYALGRTESAVLHRIRILGIKTYRGILRKMTAPRQRKSAVFSKRLKVPGNPGESDEEVTARLREMALDGLFYEGDCERIRNAWKEKAIAMLYM